MKFEPNATEAAVLQKFFLWLREHQTAWGMSPHRAVEGFVDSVNDGHGDITSFQGRNRWLSNVWSCFIKWDNVEYPSVENAYVAAKTLILEERKQFETVFPGEARRRGRLVTLRDGWETKRLDVMESLLRQKFRDGNLGRRLVKTWPAQLIEGNDYGDRFWGVCQGVGENHLGKLLMKIRDEHRTEDLERAMNGR